MKYTSAQYNRVIDKAQKGRSTKLVTSLRETPSLGKFPTRAIVCYVASLLVFMAVVLVIPDRKEAFIPAHVKAPVDAPVTVSYRWVPGVELAGE